MNLPPHSVLALFASRRSDFTAVNCATSLAKISRSAPTVEKSVESVSDLVARTAEAVATGKPNGRTLTSIAHSLGVLGHVDKLSSVCSALSAVAIASAECVERSDPGAPGAASTVLWAWGALSSTGKSSGGCLPLKASISRVLFEAAATCADLMSSAELSNAAWGAARAGVRSSMLMTALARAASRLASDGAFTPQGLANTAWAWAKLKLRPPPALHSALVSAALSLLKVSLKHTGSHRVPAFYDVWCSCPQSGSASTDDPQALAMLAWAFARWPSVPLNAMLSVAVARVLAAGRLPPQSCASLLQVRYLTR